MGDDGSHRFVSRGGEKLAATLDHFGIDVSGLTCADLGSHVGGFVDCLLRRGAAKVYSVDTAYGTLAWSLRRDPRVVVRERTNAMHVRLPERVALVTVDVGWTKQEHILPTLGRITAAEGQVLVLIKPHYECGGHRLIDGALPDQAVPDIVGKVIDRVTASGWTCIGTVVSPLRGHGGNQEVFALLRPRAEGEA
ncbi:MAG: TlyA family RNA methyltransferase [Planctomycetes bacterium]|nr:TlyA family RNA methyltransferase [Planctomycetota bacterium]